MVSPDRAVGVFGGTFDPIHAGHLRLARALRDELSLSEVRLIPAGDPYHREAAPLASAEQRLAMARLAVAGEPGLVVDEREVRRGRPSYTVETLAELRAELGPDVPIWCLIGGDSLAQLATWRRWRELFALAHLAVALRPGFDPATLPEPVAAEWRQRQVSDFPNRTPSGTIRALTLPPMDISATDLRARLGQGAAVDGLIAPAVLAYIEAGHLYGAGAARPT
ncbi:nicotinate-nucleotide adenylyltransferase [Crenobacter luteus]|uniref:nicotinate-nucleotide adenylyltransferase n=1 Tax=Crenobacter luteus TaxID=1452487 RepID=UPI00105127D7|nr:nicotinate-nucleotide adenylyltransferase [Crenobacter luteus]TCP13664.1 nicotinate-nucleotide adenylyltransferase [Crenobacter luteus]